MRWLAVFGGQAEGVFATDGDTARWSGAMMGCISTG